MPTYRIAVIGGDGIGPDVVAASQVRTPDMGGNASTEQMGEAIAQAAVEAVREA